MKAVISLTTTPPRLNHLRPTLESLLAQELPVYLWLPRWVKRLEAGFDRIPAWIKDLGVQAFLVEDVGPATKLLPALRLDVDRILTADDDHTYSTGWAKGLLAWSEKLPQAALGYRGRVLARGDKRFSYNKTRLILRPAKPYPVDLLTGVHGCLYRREFFGKNVLDEVSRWPRNDDIAVGAYLRGRGVKLYVIPRACRIAVTGADKVTPLCKANTGGKRLNDTGLKRLYGGAP